MSRHLHEVAVEVRDKAGPVVEVVPVPWGPKMVFVASPQGIHDVLSTSGDVFDQDTYFHRAARIAGDNLFNLPNARWFPRRRAMTPLFTRRASAEHVPMMSAEAAAAAATWVRRGTIDLDAATRELTLRVLGRTVYGLDLSSRAVEIGRQVSTVLSYLMDVAHNGAFLPRWVPTLSPRGKEQFEAALNSLQGVARESIELSRSVRSRQEQPNAGIVHALLELRDPDTGKPFSDAEIISELGAFLVASHDSSTTVLSYALWQLGRHPELQERIAAEVVELPDGGWYVADLNQLSCTLNVVREAMRLCPTSAVIGRQCHADSIVDGFTIAKDRIVLMSLYALHRDPSLWESPETFDPDRFTPARSAGRDKFAYIPFSAGERDCIGDQFALFHMTTTIAHIVKVARLTSVNSSFPMELRLTLRPTEPILCRLTAR